MYELGKKQPKKKKEPEINPDLDLLQGLEACSAYSEFQAYYKANYPNARDKEAFNVAATKKANEVINNISSEKQINTMGTTVL